MKEFIKKIAGWLIAAVLWLWSMLPKIIDWIGKTTLPDDWKQLMSEKLPSWAAWLFSTPWWVPALLALTLTIWMIWISWPRQGPHVPPDADVKHDTPKAIKKHELLPAPDVTTFGEKGIYIGRIFVETDKLKDDLVMLFVTVGFNASGYAFKIESVEGCVSFVSKLVDGSTEKTDLPTPRFAAERGPAGKIPNLTEFMYIFEQGVPKALASEIIESATKKHAEFHFDKLKVTVAADSTRLTIPLWEAVTIRKPWEQFSTGRIVFARMKLVEFGSIKS